MKVLYHLPSLHSVYAGRTIYHGFRNAFLDLGHEFQALTADQKMADVLEGYRPDLFITSSHFWYRRYLDYLELKKYRDRGLFTLVKIDFWNSPLSRLRVNEATSLMDDRDALRLIHSGLMGDAFFHVVEQGDARMAGFEEATGYSYHTIPLAADKTVLRPLFDKQFAADVSYIGTNLPDKRAFFKNYLFPLRKRCVLAIHGQDWTLPDRALGWLQRGGQFFNLPGLRTIRKPPLQLLDEAKVYASSIISVNVHETYQKEYGGDCNERTFKIPLCGGFQVVDHVACIQKYFKTGTEIIIADNDAHWLDLVGHYLAHPEERAKIITAGQARVLSSHTYHHRVRQIIDIMHLRGTAL